MNIDYQHTHWQLQWGSIIVQTMIADDDRVWHRVAFTNTSGTRASVDLSADEARDLYLKLKVSVDK